MTHEITTVENAPRLARLSITEAMATQYSMAPDAFMATMRATVFAKGMSREEEAAFLLVAKHHNLNPVTREIYAMPKKGGGIIPVVGVDGWIRMTNEHPAFDGMEFESGPDGQSAAMTCRIYRKDRSHPIAVTEYLDECKRPTEPWKDMPRRMLRHKAMIQCARYAFGFAGIYDPDEAERFAEPLATPRRAPSPPDAPMIEHKPAAAEPGAERELSPAPAQTGRRAPSPPAAPASQQDPAKASQPAAQAPQHFDPEKVRKRFEAALKEATTPDAINDAWMQIVDPWDADLMPPDRDDFARMCSLRQAEIDGKEGVEP